MTSQISGHLLTQKVCIKVVDVDPGLDVCVPEDFKTQETCIEAEDHLHFFMFPIIL